MVINCIIVDDEPTSRRVLEKFIADVDFLNIIGVFNNATDALNELNNNNTIDLLFLDINMPKISGLTFYKSLQNPPDVIFTTAYSQYAVDGFEVNAIDFLLKPFSFERFFKAVNKVLEKRNPQENNNNENHFLLIKSDKTLHKILSRDVIFIEALGDYVKVYLDDKYILTNNTFTNILAMLPNSKFIRTHKSFAVNIEKINTLHGNQISVSNHSIPIGQKFKADFLEAFKKG